jgi:predicted nucleic acid-binding protein
LIAVQPTSATVSGLLREYSEIAVWWGTWIECAVAISRIRREGSLDEEGQEEARSVLDLIAETWTEIPPTDDIPLLAALVSKQHPLKAADALQLAAALRWCEGDTSGTGFVCLDGRLRRAASWEGFCVLPMPYEEGTG